MGVNATAHVLAGGRVHSQVRGHSWNQGPSTFSLDSEGISGSRLVANCCSATLMCPNQEAELLVSKNKTLTRVEFNPSFRAVSVEKSVPGPVLKTLNSDQG